MVTSKGVSMRQTRPRQRDIDMLKSYNVNEFVKALAGGLPKPSATVEGFVKSHDDTKYLSFSPGSTCSFWVPVPVALIESIDHLGTRPCGAEEHEFVRLHLKVPTTPEAEAFSQLLGKVSAQPTAYAGMPAVPTAHAGLTAPAYTPAMPLTGTFGPNTISRGAESYSVYEPTYQIQPSVFHLHAPPNYWSNWNWLRNTIGPVTLNISYSVIGSTNVVAELQYWKAIGSSMQLVQEQFFNHTIIRTANAYAEVDIRLKGLGLGSAVDVYVSP
jgi:hypothetical protein